MKFKKYIYILFILIILIIIVNLNTSKLNNKKPTIWMYWENMKNKKKPNYLNLCYKTISKHCKKDFNQEVL